MAYLYAPVSALLLALSPVSEPSPLDMTSMNVPLAACVKRMTASRVMLCMTVPDLVSYCSRTLFMISATCMVTPASTIQGRTA